MGQIARRRALWLHGGGAAVVLAATLWLAARTMDVAPFLVMGIVIEGILLVSAARILRVQRGPWAEHLHTNGRWTTLSILRFSAVVTAITFLVVAFVTTLFGEAVPTASLAILGVTTLACILGAIAEREAPHASPDAEALVYKTRRGVVKVMKAGKKREYVLTGDPDVRGLTDIERAIDKRGWTETDVPTDDRLKAALERWGRFETR